jgi:hypothetical protein
MASREGLLRLYQDLGKKSSAFVISMVLKQDSTLGQYAGLSDNPIVAFMASDHGAAPP